MHFPKCKSAFARDTQASPSPAAQKALPFTFKQHNNNQWSIINAKIIHVHSWGIVLSVKPLKSCRPYSGLHRIHDMVEKNTYHSCKYWPKIYIYPKIMIGFVLPSTKMWIFIFLFLIAQRPYCLQWSWTINIDQILLRHLILSVLPQYLLSLHFS